MKSLKNLNQFTVLATSSDFRWKILFTKPLRYLIQLATGSRIEHVAFYFEGLITDATGEGVKSHSIDEWFNLHISDGVNLYIYEFDFPFTDVELRKIRIYIKEQLKNPYSIFRAMYSALPINLPPFIEMEEDDRKQLCSKFVYDTLEACSRLPIINADKICPKELIHQLNKSQLTTGRQKCGL